MKKQMGKADWDQQYAAGKWRFLHNPNEQRRLQAMAGLIADLADGRDPITLVDLGCGEGQLYPYLEPDTVARYVGVDISSVALEGLVDGAIPVTRICSSLEDFVWDEASAAVVFVASEVLTYNDNSVQQLDRIVGAARNAAACIVSVVGPHAEKPNWTAASKKFWAEMAQLPWPKPTRLQIQDPDSAIVWDIARYEFAP